MLSQVLQRRLSFWYFHFHSEMLANLQQFFKLQEDCQWPPRSCFCVKCIEGERQEWHSWMMYILFWKCILSHSKTLHNTLAICIIWLDMCWCLRMRFLFTHWLSQQEAVVLWHGSSWHFDCVYVTYILSLFCGKDGPAAHECSPLQRKTTPTRKSISPLKAHIHSMSSTTWSPPRAQPKASPPMSSLPQKSNPEYPLPLFFWSVGF
jgi:hypothetical protein